MAPSIDYEVLSLLCAEENDGIYCDDDAEFGGVVEDFDATWQHHANSSQNLSFKGVQEESMTSGFPLLSDESLSLMLKSECDFLPGSDYLSRFRNGDLDLVVARQQAVDWIGKVQAHFNFSPLCVYLSVSYLDRFLSAYDLPKGKAWSMQLLAVACLSIAAKMEETDVPLCLDLQVGDAKFVFEARTIQRMELLVLSTLKWRMNAITPFSFIDYFLAKMNGDQIVSKLSIYRSTQLILSTIKGGIDFLEFRPSEIAVAVAISVAGETQTVDTEKALYELFQPFEKERVVKSVELMNKSSFLTAVKGGSSGGSVPNSVPQSPIGVLDAACLSYRTDDSTVGSCANSSHCSPPNKRRKLNRQTL